VAPLLRFETEVFPALNFFQPAQCWHLAVRNMNVNFDLHHGNCLDVKPPPLKSPFPYFGGKSGAVAHVWQAFGVVKNYVEPFAGSAAMLLGAPPGKRIETINDFDGFVANFWRAIAQDPEAVAHHADWPCNEVDLFARHSWLVRSRLGLTDKLHADPDFYDAKVAGWWCWGACNWIGSGWCSGEGPWVLHDGRMVKGNAGQGINRQLPHLGNAGQGINRQLPHLGDAGKGINRNTEQPRRAYIMEWFGKLHARMRDVRVACGDWQRVCKDSVTTRHGLTAVFLDPPYAKGAMDYGAGGMGLGIAEAVQAWCAANGQNKALRIVLCGHAGEHDALLAHGWHTRTWTARKGYALTDEAVANSAGETLWCSPHCVPVVATATAATDLFAKAA
jgi:site-specific DNA-adenine methylase